MNHCQVTGCQGKASRYGRYCSTHKTRHRRHGDAQQRAISKTDLQPYLQFVDTVIARNSSSNLWPIVEERWEGLVKKCQAIIQRYHGGRPTSRFDLQAAHAVAQLSTDTTAQDILRILGALFVLRYDTPRAFVSDRAFIFQVARRCRGLSTMSAGSWYDNSTGRVKLVYRDLTPNSTELFSTWIIEQMGAIALRFAKIHETEKGKQAQAKQHFNKALGEIQ